jgi:hypothetical protein
MLSERCSRHHFQIISMFWLTLILGCQPVCRVSFEKSVT